MPTEVQSSLLFLSAAD